MKKIIVLLLISLLLVACANEERDTEETTEETDSVVPRLEEDGSRNMTANGNISDEVIGDSYQAMRVIEKSVEVDEKPDMDILFDYTDKYIDGYDGLDLTDEEKELILFTGVMITKSDKYVTINSEREDFEEDIEKWFKILKTGEYPSE